MQPERPAEPTRAPWPAPRAASPVDRAITLPGSKSITNRALVLAAIADGPSRVIAPLRARDTLLMADALRALGVGIADDTTVEAPGDSSVGGTRDWVVTPGPLHGATIDTGLAGTVMRFVPPVAALAAEPVTFDGDAYARERPMATLFDGLRQAGVHVTDDGGRMPFTVHGTGAVPGGTVRVDASGSSQFVSALLLAGARFDKGLELVHDAPTPVPSAPHIAMTLALLRERGVTVDLPAAGVWAVAPGPVAALDTVVEPDLSNAAPFLAAALITGGTVRVPAWPTRTTQPGDELRALLARMGAEVSVGDTDHPGLTVRGTGTINGLVADLREVSELVTVVAVLAALAHEPSVLTGLGHMRGHETDRLAALSTELTGLGADVTEGPDYLEIRPQPLHGGLWHAYADHRMATAGALLGLVVDGVEIDDIGCTSKTLPDFPGMWADLLAG